MSYVIAEELNEASLADRTKAVFTKCAVLWLGELISIFGSQFFLVSIPWLMAGSAFFGRNVAMIMASASLPKAVLMPLGGIATDRWSPRNILLITNLGRGIISFAMGYLAVRTSVPLVAVVVLMLVYGSADGFFYPSFLSAVPRLVPTELVHRANAGFATITGIAGAIGPALAGIYIAKFGIASAFAFDGASFILAGLTILLIGKHLRARPVNTEASIAQSLMNGVRVVWRDKVLRGAVLISALVNIAIGGPYFLGTVLKVQMSFSEAPKVFGILFSASGAGVLIGALCAAVWYPKQMHLKVVVNVLLILIGGALLVFGLARGVVHMVIARALIGIAVGYLDVLGYTLIQSRATRETLGRVVSLFTVTISGVQPLSYLISGAVANRGAGLLLLISGVAAIGALPFTHLLETELPRP